MYLQQNNILLLTELLRHKRQHAGRLDLRSVSVNIRDKYRTRHHPHAQPS